MSVTLTKLPYFRCDKNKTEKSFSFNFQDIGCTNCYDWVLLKLSKFEFLTVRSFLRSYNLYYLSFLYYSNFISTILVIQGIFNWLYFRYICYLLAVMEPFIWNTFEFKEFKFWIWAITFFKMNAFYTYILRFFVRKLFEVK